MLPPGRNKVPSWIKQGGGLDSACWPCVCHLWFRSYRDLPEPTQCYLIILLLFSIPPFKLPQSFNCVAMKERFSDCVSGTRLKRLGWGLELPSPPFHFTYCLQWSCPLYLGAQGNRFNIVICRGLFPLHFFPNTLFPPRNHHLIERYKQQNWWQ